MTPEGEAAVWRARRTAQSRRDMELAGLPATAGTQAKNAAPLPVVVRPVSAGPQASQGLSAPTVKTASATLALPDLSHTIVMDVASPHFLTVPTDANVAFPVGARIPIIRVGAGETTVVAQSGVSLHSVGGSRQLPQWGQAWVWKRAANSWVLTGDLQT